MRSDGDGTPMLQFERDAQERGFRLIVGIDEAGRGPLAGPVVASAVALKSFQFQNKIADSKELTHQQRESAFPEIMAKAYVGVGIVSETVIDTHNILKATFFAMTRAVADMISRLPGDVSGRDDFEKDVLLLVDGNRFESPLPYLCRTIVAGDSLSLSIACASIVAKVTRDRILTEYDKVFPQYGFSRHKGYPTAEHRQAIKKHGLSPIHRKTFRHE